MKLDRLALRNFRNYERLESSFSPGVNLIVGDNAQGKTNLLEAVFYLSTGRSFRTRREMELIRFGSEFADLEGDVTGQARQQSLRALLFASRKPRQLFLNGVKKRSHGEMSGILTTVLFCPEDLLVLKAGAAARRRFLDQALCQLRPRYEAALTEYNRILEQKSKILRDRFENPSLLQVLPEYSHRLCQVGAILISYRARFLKSLEEEATRFHREFSGEKRPWKSPTAQSPLWKTLSPPCRPWNRLFFAHLDSHHGAELESAQCLTGPHKDDFDASLDGLSLKSYGSQGQTRTAAISLKLAQRELARRDTGEEPVLLLDDVLSELDPGRQDFVLNQIRSGQVFITCCEKDRLTKLGQVLQIQAGNLIL